MVNIAIFASGNGSNYQAIMEYFHQKPHPNLKVALVVCDRSNAGVISKAFKWKIPTVLANPKRFTSKEDYEYYILSKLQEYEIEFIALAGYMRIIGSPILNRYQGKIINLHPSLLPAFPGIDGVGQALEAGVCVTGVTVHFVDAGLDTGPIIAQEPVKIERNDTHASLSKKIQKIEHRMYPQILRACALNEIMLKDNQIIWQDKLNKGVRE